MKTKTIVLTSSLVVILAVAAYAFFKKDSNTQIEWRTAKIEKGNLSITVNATGSLEADTTVDVGTQVSGTISQIFVDYNSKVKKGEVVAMIDTTNLVASLDNARAGLQSADAQLNLAKQNFDRTKVLYDSKQVAKATYDQDLANYKTALSNLAVAKARVTAAQISLNYATITAPIGGVVISRNVNVGQTVAASFNTPTLFTIANDLTKMQVQASIDEADIGQIKKGQSVEFTVDAYPNDVFKGKVRQIRLEPVVTSGVVTYTVIIDVSNPDLKLLPGMTANITVLVKEHKDINKVPAMALQFKPPLSYMQKLMSSATPQEKKNYRQIFGMERRQSSAPSTPTEFVNQRSLNPGDKAILWVKNGNSVVPKEVTVGLSNGSSTEVSGNIKSNENVVIGAIAPQASSNQVRSPFSRRR